MGRYHVGKQYDQDMRKEFFFLTLFLFCIKDIVPANQYYKISLKFDISRYSLKSFSVLVHLEFL